MPFEANIAYVFLHYIYTTVVVTLQIKTSHLKNYDELINAKHSKIQYINYLKSAPL